MHIAAHALGLKSKTTKLSKSSVTACCKLMVAGATSILCTHCLHPLCPPATDKRPPWLSKPGYLDFASLRAYPLRQLHNICGALHKHELPLGHPAVLMLMQQAMYQLGELTDTDVPQRLWRTGWDSDKGVLHTLHEELCKLADELLKKTREHEAVLLLGEVSGQVLDE